MIAAKAAKSLDAGKKAGMAVKAVEEEIVVLGKAANATAVVDTHISTPAELGGVDRRGEDNRSTVMPDTSSRQALGGGSAPYVVGGTADAAPSIDVMMV